MARTATRSRASQPPEALWAPTGTLTIDTVASHWTTVHALLGASPALAADLSAIERVDTAGVQLLVQVRRIAAGVGQTVQVRGLTMSPDVRHLLGISDEAASAARVTPAGVVGQEG